MAWLFLHATLCASVGGILLFALRAFRQRDRALARCKSLDDRRREAVRLRLESDEATRVWRGAAGLANQRAREAENATRLWRRNAEDNAELVHCLADAIAADPVDLPEPPKPAAKPRLN